MASSYKTPRATTITAIHPEFLESEILTRLDAPTLAATACTSPKFKALCTHEKLWRAICNSKFTSTKHHLIRDTVSTFPGGHHSLFSDSLFPIHHPDHHRVRHSAHHCPPPTELISAVDIHYKNKLIYSEVVVTNTSTNSSLDSEFQVQLFHKKGSVTIPGKFEGDEDVNFSDLKSYMTLSWIVIDPALKRAANVSSLQPVTVRPHWIGGDIEVKYATIVAGDYSAGMSKFVECKIVVMLGWKEERELEIRGARLQVVDMDRKCLNGKESLGVFREAMQSGKRKKRKLGEEKLMYMKYVQMKIVRKEEREKWDRRVKMVREMIRSPATIFPAWVFLAFFCVSFFYFF